MKLVPYLAATLRSEAILIAALPFLGWVAAFIFETGYLSFFDISWSFIDIGISHILTAIIALLIFAVAIAPFVSYVAAAFLASRRAKTALLLSVPLGSLVFLILNAYRGERIWNLLLTAASIFGAILFLAILFEVFRQKAAPASKSLQVIDSVANEATAVMKKNDVILAAFLNPAFCVAAICFFISFTGYVFAALTTAETLVLESKPDYVFVRKYGDTYLFKQFDIPTLSLAGGLHIVKIGDGKDLQMHRVWLPALQGHTGAIFKEKIRYLFFGYETDTVDTSPRPRLPI